MFRLNQDLTFSIVSLSSIASSLLMFGVAASMVITRSVVPHSRKSTWLFQLRFELQFRSGRGLCQDQHCHCCCIDGHSHSFCCTASTGITQVPRAASIRRHLGIEPKAAARHAARLRVFIHRRLDVRQWRTSRTLATSGASLFSTPIKKNASISIE